MDFGYSKFYRWCAKQKNPLFISSYEMPSDKFCCIKKIMHNSILSASANLKVVEKVFIPKHQAQSYELPGELFSWREVG